MPILTAIDNIKLNCDGIAKLCRIATRLKRLHQNPGQSTNCKQMSPIAPESVSYCNQSGVRAQSTRNQSNAGTIFCNHVDCGGIAGSMQSHCNPVATCHNSIFRPMAPTNQCLIPTQTIRSCHNHESPCHQIEMQWDCKSTKDCDLIDKIA